MKKLNFLFVGFLFLLLLFACRGGNSDNKQTNDKSFETPTDKSNIKKALENIYFLFPSPAEILYTINEGGIVYDSKLPNSNEKKEMYVKSNEKYLNLGIYMADLSYCALFNRINEAENYFETIKEMSDDLHLSTKIKKELIEKIKANINSVDSISKITNEFFFDMLNDLESNNRQTDVTIITAGAYIECLYLTVNQVKVFSKDNLIVQKIVEQKNAYNILYEYSQKHISNKDLTQSFSFIQQINDAFGRLCQQNKEIDVKKDAENHLVISGGGTTVSSEPEFMSFKESITKIRNSITK